MSKYFKGDNFPLADDEDRTPKVRKIYAAASIRNSDTGRATHLHMAAECEDTDAEIEVWLPREQAIALAHHILSQLGVNDD